MNDDLSGQLAVVTGASSGIGQAIALALAERHADLHLIARNVERLDAVAARADALGASSTAVTPLDLQDSAAVASLASQIGQQHRQLQILVHCAGEYGRGATRDASLQDVSRLHQTNVMGPYALTQALLPLLIEARGDIVFVNSSICFRATADTGPFAATQAALKTVADTLREEVNKLGVRVMNLFPGRTATPRQARIFEHEGAVYQPERLMQPEDVASVVVHGLLLPRTTEVTEIRLRPMQGGY